MGRVQGKVAIVTGGALGLGAAAAIKLAREGASVVVTDINDFKGSKIMERIVSGGGECYPLHP